MKKKIIAALLVVCVCLAACGNNKTEVQPTTEQTSQQTSAQKDEQKPQQAEQDQQAEKTDEQKADQQETQPSEQQREESDNVGIVIDNLLSLSGEYTDEVANDYVYSYELPIVSGVSTEYVGEVNTDIQRIKEMFVDSELQSMEAKCSLDCESVRYTFDVYKGIYSLIVIVDTDYDMSFFYIYHFDEQGNKVENKELLEAANMTEEDFLKAETAILSEQTEYDSSISSEFAEELKRARENTLSEANCNVNVPIYVDGEGTVSFVGTVYSIAGADSYDYLFTIQYSFE